MSSHPATMTRRQEPAEDIYLPGYGEVKCRISERIGANWRVLARCDAPVSVRACCLPKVERSHRDAFSAVCGEHVDIFFEISHYRMYPIAYLLWRVQFMAQKKYSDSQRAVFYRALEAGETGASAADKAGINRNAACRMAADWRKGQVAMPCDVDITAGDTARERRGQEACAEVLPHADASVGSGLERIATALEGIGEALTTLVARIPVVKPSTAQEVASDARSSASRNGTGNRHPLRKLDGVSEQTRADIGRSEAIVAEEDAKAAMSAYPASERAVADDSLNDFDIASEN